MGLQPHLPHAPLLPQRTSATQLPLHSTTPTTRPLNYSPHSDSRRIRASAVFTSIGGCGRLVAAASCGLPTAIRRPLAVGNGGDCPLELTRANGVVHVAVAESGVELGVFDADSGIVVVAVNGNDAGAGVLDHLVLPGMIREDIPADAGVGVGSAFPFRSRSLCHMTRICMTSLRTPGRPSRWSASMPIQHRYRRGCPGPYSLRQMLREGLARLVRGDDQVLAHRRRATRR